MHIYSEYDINNDLGILPNVTDMKITLKMQV